MRKSDLEAYKISLERCRNRLADKNAEKEVISSFGHGSSHRNTTSLCLCSSRTT